MEIYNVRVFFKNLGIRIGRIYCIVVFVIVFYLNVFVIYILSISFWWFFGDF